MITTQQLCRHTPFVRFEIWSPRYHDNKVLLKRLRVGRHNKIVFTKAPSMGTEPYYISGAVVKRHKVVSNGTIDVYAVDLNKLVPLDIAERCEHDYE